MAEETSKLVDFTTLKEDALVKIEISAAMYYRIQTLLLAGIPFTNVDQMQKVLSTIKNSQEDPDMVTYHTRTLMTLIAIIEKEAINQGQTQTRQINPIKEVPTN